MKSKVRKRARSETPLHNQGFEIYKLMFNINEELLDEIKSQIKRGNIIFNYNKKQKKNDKKRSQIPFEPRNKLATEFISEIYSFWSRSIQI